jgi:hypothetical protein
MAPARKNRLSGAIINCIAKMKQIFQDAREGQNIMILRPPTSSPTPSRNNPQRHEKSFAV